ncbi:TPA: UbiD family decarboxylase domain-containing protein [Serratia fonticola]|jgi:3-polyprenyl-4-hydroxybenzoate decarboxylase|uniref:UbiD family decarboxylase n=1 Tax=Serratia TaxID=613 RepID=UPI000EF5146D|nr:MULTISPECIES: UbiD family decarboxylase [Serratia]AYM90307.1 UbiD family decarboxylase [Serratia sp. 3ACOL1]CAI0791638.1 3-octaprenyl-4-hydroxybenzoate carboxy-lyase [Serratia fonticola]
MKRRKLKIDVQKVPKSYRAYLELLASKGEVVAIPDEVDWYLEIGAILRHACETESPMPLFSKVKGAPGFRAAEMGPTVSRVPGKRWQRLALMLGLPDDAQLLEIQDAFLDAIGQEPHPPVMVDPATAPCKQNKWVGDQVDMTKIPAPILHDGDGGRYFQTAGAIMVRTPPGEPVPEDAYTVDKDAWTNWSFSRAMIAGSRPQNNPTPKPPHASSVGVPHGNGPHYSKNNIVGLWLPFQHNGMIYNMWTAQGKDCPFVIALGVPPAVTMLLSAAPPAWHDEYNYASAFLGHGIEMVKAETCDVLVPAECEIIIEGYVSADKSVAEGPFGEFPGYLSNQSSLKPLAKITCVTFRDEAILPICIPGVPIDSTLMLGCFCLSATARVYFEKSGLPVIDCFSPLEASSHWLVIRVRDDWHKITGMTVKAFIDKIAEVFWTNHIGKTTAKLIIVGEDIPPDDSNKVTWALATRNNPVQGVFHYPQYDSDGTGLQIYLDVATKLRGRGGLVAYSCLQIQQQVNQPLEQVLSFATNYPLPLQEKIKSKWSEWGFDR